MWVSWFGWVTFARSDICAKWVWERERERQTDRQTDRQRERRICIWSPFVLWPSLKSFCSFEQVLSQKEIGNNYKKWETIFSTINFISVFLAISSRHHCPWWGLDSNPRPWDGEASVSSTMPPLVRWSYVVRHYVLCHLRHALLSSIYVALLLMSTLMSTVVNVAF